MKFLFTPFCIATLSLSLLLGACGGGGSTNSNLTNSSNASNAGSAVVIPTFTPPSLPKGGIPNNWKLVWADEFDQPGLPNSNNWVYDIERNKAGWHNNELQYYSKERLENSHIINGNLIITALKEQLSSAPDFGGQAYTSARLLSRGKASWTYGFFEIRARFSCGLGTWPAIWMLGNKGAWPDDGEIDIMEHVGKNKGQVLGSAYSNYYNWAVGRGNTKATTIADACDNFHLYQLYWDKDQLAIAVDGNYYFQFANQKDGDYKKWPFDSPQYLILNLAIGGDLGGPVSDTALPATMEVDYVRVYQP